MAMTFQSRILRRIVSRRIDECAEETTNLFLGIEMTRAHTRDGVVLHVTRSPGPPLHQWRVVRQACSALIGDHAGASIIRNRERK